MAIRTKNPEDEGLLGGSRRHWTGLGGLGYGNLLTRILSPPHTNSTTP